MLLPSHFRFFVLLSWVFGLVAWVILVTPALPAQTSGTGSIQGTVTDATDRLFPVPRSLPRAPRRV